MFLLIGRQHYGSCCSCRSPSGSSPIRSGFQAPPWARGSRVAPQRWHQKAWIALAAEQQQGSSPPRRHLVAEHPAPSQECSQRRPGARRGSTARRSGRKSAHTAHVKHQTSSHTPPRSHSKQLHFTYLLAVEAAHTPDGRRAVGEHLAEIAAAVLLVGLVHKHDLCLGLQCQQLRADDARILEAARASFQRRRRCAASVSREVQHDQVVALLRRAVPVHQLQEAVREAPWRCATAPCKILVMSDSVPPISDSVPPPLPSMTCRLSPPTVYC